MRAREEALAPACGTPRHPSTLLEGVPAVYGTQLGAAFHGDASLILKDFPARSVKAVITSPPYALGTKKEYGNVRKNDYIQWFLPVAREIKRVLTRDGSFVLNIGGSYNKGEPTRSLYHYKLLISLCEDVGFYLAQECFWHNPAKLPSPAEWVNVQRSRIKDTVEYIWWLCPTQDPDADNRRVLTPYSTDMLRLLERGYVAKRRPSGHQITAKFRNGVGGSIPPNIIICGNNESNSSYLRACQELGIKIHPARFPAAIPRFFVEFLTKPGEIVVDPFAGSNTTGRVAEDMGRRWVAIDIALAYVRASAVRFGLNPHEL
jgi:DNA modification methylase